MFTKKPLPKRVILRAVLMLCFLSMVETFVRIHARGHLFRWAKHRARTSVPSSSRGPNSASRRRWSFVNAAPTGVGRRRRGVRFCIMTDQDEVTKNPQLIVPFIMKSLELNDFPEIDSGLTRVWDLSGDTTKGIFNHNLTEFIECAHQTAEEFPTSFYGAAMFGKNWTLDRPMVMVGGDTSECWIATQLLKTVSSDGRMRRWQSELR